MIFEKGEVESGKIGTEEKYKGDYFCLGMLTIDYSDHHIPFGQTFIQVLFASKDSVCEEKKREYFSGGKGGGGLKTLTSKSQ